MLLYEHHKHRFRTYSPDKMPEELRTVLLGLSVLSGSMYGELALKAKQLIDDSLVRSDAQKSSCWHCFLLTPFNNMLTVCTLTSLLN